MKKTILIAEDNVAILTGLTDFLTHEGFDVVTATDGESALKLYEEGHPDLLILDIMMPGISGWDVCKEIRKKDSSLKIIMLTAKGEETDKVVGLEMGADDYLVKPFSLKELLARIRAVLRRAADNTEQSAEIMSFGDVSINPNTLQGTKSGEQFDVSLREIQLLQYFCANEGVALDRYKILDKIWGVKYGGTTRTLDQHVSKLRHKIEDDPQNPRYIVTVHRVGYRFIADPS
ncbi:MAG: response regulator transcription factor [Candidatus Omnitrophica bacterium]|nr:response regulator transcription factor [Candidatus Omnitrophota bacterium]MCB9720329.1 response regulator transcription factor [Candidatus Omnitrophota bacterium]